MEVKLVVPHVQTLCFSTASHECSKLHPSLICEAENLFGKFPILGAVGFHPEYAKMLIMLQKRLQNQDSATFTAVSSKWRFSEKMSKSRSLMSAFSCTRDLICGVECPNGKFPILGATGFRPDYAKMLKMLQKCLPSQESAADSWFGRHF